MVKFDFFGKSERRVSAAAAKRVIFGTIWWFPDDNLNALRYQFKFHTHIPCGKIKVKFDFGQNPAAALLSLS